MQNRFILLSLPIFVVPWASVDGEKSTGFPEKFQGEWSVVATEYCGKTPPPDVIRQLQVTIKQKSIVVSALVFEDGAFKIDNTPDELLYEINPTLKQFDVFLKNGEKQHRMLGIYNDDGDTLKLCWQHDGLARPKEFKTQESPIQFLLVLKRAAPK